MRKFKTWKDYEKQYGQYLAKLPQAEQIVKEFGSFKAFYTQATKGVEVKPEVRFEKEKIREEVVEQGILPGTPAREFPREKIQPQKYQDIFTFGSPIMPQEDLPNMPKSEKYIQPDLEKRSTDTKEKIIKKAKKEAKTKEEAKFIEDYPDVGLATKTVIPPEIEMKDLPKDLVGFPGWFMSWIYPVRHIAEMNPIANKIAHMGRDTMSFMTQETDYYSSISEKIYKGIKDNRREVIADMLNRKPSEEELNALSSKELEAYQTNREILKEAKEIASYMKGVDVKKWSIPDDQYFPHIFVGQYQIKDGDKTIPGGFARTKGEALDKAEAYAKEHPEHKLNIAPKEIGGEWTATLLTRKGFWRFVNQVEKATTISSDQLRKILEKGKWVTEEESVSVTEKVKTQKAIKKDLAKVESKVKEALSHRGWGEGEVEQMITRLKESKSTEELHQNVETIIERTIEKVKKIKKVYDIGENEKIRVDVLSALRGVAAIKPRPKFMPNFERRLANLDGYIKDPEMAIKIYMSRLIRKKWLDPYRRQATDLSLQLPPGLRNYFLELIDGVSGKYDPINRQFSISRTMGKISRAQGFLKLGYRPSTAAINLFQPLHTTFNEIGHHLFAGYRQNFTPLGKEINEIAGISGQKAKYYALETFIPATEKLYMPLGMFSTAEQLNRGATINGSYRLARKVFDLPAEKITRLGYDYINDYYKNASEYVDNFLSRYLPEKKIDITKEFDKLHQKLTENFPATALETKNLDDFKKLIAAIEYGKDVNADTQYIYDASDLPKIFRTRPGRVLFQFKSYPLNTLLQMGEWIKASINNPTPHNIARVIRIIGSNIVIGGVKLPLEIFQMAADIVTPFRGLWQKVVVAILTAIAMQKNKKVRRTLNTIYRGIFAYIGVDLSERIAPDIYIPRNIAGLFGPTASDMYNLVRDIESGKKPLEIVLRPFLFGKGIYDLATQDEIRQLSRKRLLIRPKAWEKVLNSLQITPLRVGEARDMDEIMRVIESNYERERRKVLDKIIEKAAKEQDFADDYIKAANKGLIITNEMLNREYKAKETPLTMRRWRTLPPMLKIQFLPFLEESLRDEAREELLRE